MATKRDSKGRFVGGGGSGSKGGSSSPTAGGTKIGAAAIKKSGLVLSGDWKKYGATLDTFADNFSRLVGLATERNAIEVRDEIRRRIDQKKYGENAPRTLILKGGGYPLVGKSGSPEKAKGASGGGTGAALLKSLAYEMEGPLAAVVGVNRWAVWKGRKNIGKIVHDGIVINVTDKMRKYFLFLAFKYGDKGFKPLHPKTTKIRIPPRPFIKTVVDDGMVQARMKKEWSKAVDAAFAGGK